MSEVFRKPLGDVVTFQRGYDITKKEQTPGPYPVISSGGVASCHAEFRDEGPGVVIGRKGSLGGVYWSEGPYWPHDTTLWVRDFKGNDPRYVYYFLQTLGLERFDAGASNPTLNRNHLHLLEVAVLHRKSQTAVADVLRTFDRLIENNRRRIEILEEMARLIYREWFVHFRFPGHEDVELVDSDLGPIPEGWDVAPASLVFEINPRERVNKAVEHNFITMADLSESSMVCLPSELKAGNSGAKFRNGDTLFARITPCLENGKTGFVACLDKGEVARGSTEFIVLRGAKVGPEFTYLTAREERLRQNAIKSMTGASGRQRVRNECFDSHLLVFPTPQVEEAFREVVEPMFELVFSLARQNTVLSEARDLLLPRIISGELDVSDLNLDLEPVA